MKYIEFIGLPGAGKSRWTQEIRSLLRERGLHPLMRVEIIRAMMRELLDREHGLLWKLARLSAFFMEYRVANLLWEKTRSTVLFRFLAAHPDFSRQVIDCAHNAVPPHWISAEVICAENLIDWLFTHGVQYQAACELGEVNDILIMEEGFCQQSYYLTAFYQGHFEEMRLYDYLSVTPQPDVFVALLPDAEECERRMNLREKGVASDILAPLTAPQRLELLEHRAGVYKKIADYWEERSVQVIRVRNETASEVKALLNEELLPLVSA